MKRTLMIAGGAIVLMVLVPVLIVSCRGGSQASTTSVPAVVQVDSVVADGTVLPIVRSELAFSLAGRVAVVAVEEGATVAAGQVLGTLDDAAARAAVSAAKAETEAARAAVGQATASVDAATASLEKANAAREGVSDGSADWRKEAADADIALAEAQLRAAEAEAAAMDARLAVARAKAEQAAASLDELTIRAPFSGVVTFVSVRAGDLVAPSTVAFRIADLSAWEIITTDLDEASIASVLEGASALLTFDALPGAAIPGSVTEIGLVGQPYQGITVFPVTVVPTGAADGLRWGLTATVEISVPTDPGATP